MYETKFLNIEFFFNQVLDFFTNIWSVFNGAFGVNLVSYIKVFLSLISILFITGIIYSVIRILEIKKEDKEKFAFIEPVSQKMGERYERWEIVQTHIESDNPSDWKLAIIEADTILDDMVKKIGYTGDSLGEKLKSVEVSDFTNVQSAWEAHKVRNQIAHEGSGFELTHREARRVIGLYKNVFEEFEYI